MPMERLLHDAGLYVSVVNTKLVHGYGNNDLRWVKTDRKDTIKLANYDLDHWLTLPRYIPKEDTRLLLKNCCRQYRQHPKTQTILKNNLISLSDTVLLKGAPMIFMPKSKTAKLLVEQGASQHRATFAALAALKQEIQHRLAAALFFEMRSGLG